MISNWHFFDDCNEVNLIILGSTLIPDESSPVGKEVARLWKLINAVKVEIITFGVVNFQDLSKSGLHPMAQGMKGS